MNISSIFTLSLMGISMKFQVHQLGQEAKSLKFQLFLTKPTQNAQRVNIILTLF